MLQNRELSWLRCGCLEGFSPVMAWVNVGHSSAKMLSAKRSFLSSQRIYSKSPATSYAKAFSIPNTTFSLCWRHSKSTKHKDTEVSFQSNTHLGHIWTGIHQAINLTVPFGWQSWHQNSSPHHQSSHHSAPCLILNCMLNPPQARRERSLWRQHLDARARDFHTTAAEICWQGNML